MLNKEIRMDIKQLHREGHSIKEIARMTGYSRNTIRKILRNGYDDSEARQKRKSKLDDYKGYIESKFKEGRPVGRILKDIKQMGYTGEKTQVYRFLQPFRREVKRREKLTVRYETAPGEQAQVDWGHCGHIIDLDGKKKKLYVFAYVLSYSRACYVEFTTSMNLDTLISCHKNAFDYFGGVTEKILYDNMKTVRLSPSQLNPAFVDFADYYGFCIKTCRPYRARTKGKVERLIDYFKVNFLPERVFSSMQDANAQSGHWMEYEANCRVHGTTGKRPNDLLGQEKLINHRQILPYIVSCKERRKADFEGFISYKGNRYSVPAEAAGKTVGVEHIGESIKIHLADMVVAEHKQPEGKGCTVAAKEHISEMWKLTLQASKAPEKTQTPVFKMETDVQARELSCYEELCQ